MKYLLLSATTAFVLAGSAQAQVAFEKATASIVASTVSGFDAYILDSSIDAAFSTNAAGFQFGGSLETRIFGSSSYTFGDFTLRYYKPTANGNKFGAYVSSTGLAGFFSGAIVGAEAMVSLGPVDIEASVGLPTGFFFGNFTYATVDGYFDIGERLTLNAGYDVVFDQYASIGSWTAGASYDLPNSGMAVSAFVNGYDSGNTMFGAGLSWSFGGNLDERLWSDRSVEALFSAP